MAAYALLVVLGLGCLLIVLGLVKMVLESDDEVPTEPTAVEQPIEMDLSTPVRLLYQLKDGGTITILVWNAAADHRRSVGSDRVFAQRHSISVVDTHGVEEVLHGEAQGVMTLDKRGNFADFRVSQGDFDARKMLKDLGLTPERWSWEIKRPEEKRSA